MKKQPFQYSAVNTITHNLYNDICSLEDICTREDKIQFKLELDFKLKFAQIQTNPINESTNNENEFLCYNERQLIGYIGICSFGGDALEVNGMVHPDYRKQGIFTSLYHMVYTEFEKRDAKKMLLICDKNAEFGLKYIEQLDTKFHHAEHDMCLKKIPNTKNYQKYRITPYEFDMKNHVFVANLGDQSIGEVRLEILSDCGGIYGLEIYQSFRGKGYGRELLSWSIKKLISLGCKTIFLQVDTLNEQALNLYHSCNFEERNTLLYYELSK